MWAQFQYLGWSVPLRNTIKRRYVWATNRRLPSVVTLLLRMAPFPPGAESGGNRPNVARNDRKRSQTPLRSLPTGSNPPPVTNDVSVERFGPWETQHGAYRGPFGSVLSRFAHPKPHFGLMWAETVIWAYLGLRGSNRISEGTFSRYNPPFFAVPTPQNGSNAPLDLSRGHF